MQASFHLIGFFLERLSNTIEGVWYRLGETWSHLGIVALIGETDWDFHI